MDVTTQEARDRLDQAGGPPLGGDRDRRVHGLATAGFGVAFGLFVVLDAVAEGHGWWWGDVVMAGYVAVLCGLAAWQTTAARTVPRHAKRLGWIGMAGAVPLMLAAIITLNVPSLADPPVWLLVLLPALVALPMVVAGHRIVRSSRR